MISRFACAAIGCALSIGIATTVAAAPTTYAFRGKLTEAALWSGANSAWAFEVGNTFSGTLVYDPAAVRYGYDYINTPEFKLSFYTSPVVAFSYQIETKAGTFAYSPPVQGGYAAVGAATTSAGWSGIDLRFHNYPSNFGRWTSPEYPVPASGYVSQYYAHSSFLSLLDSKTRALTGTAVDVDLAALFAALPPSSYSFSLRFSDPTLWKEKPGVERIDGIVDGRIDSLTRIGSAVPEPASWGMMILGFVIMGGVLRRRPPNRGQAGIA